MSPHRSSSRQRNIVAEKQLQILWPAAYPECELRRIVCWQEIISPSHYPLERPSAYWNALSATGTASGPGTPQASCGYTCTCVRWKRKKSQVSKIQNFASTRWKQLQVRGGCKINLLIPAFLQGLLEEKFRALSLHTCLSFLRKLQSAVVKRIAKMLNVKC